MHPVLLQFGPLLIPSYGACAALGVLMALALVQQTSKRVGILPRHGWNMLVLAVFSALVVSRLLLIVANLADLRRHPIWLLSIAMVHHPLLAGAGIVGAAIAVLLYSLWARLPLRAVGDCLASPVALGMAAEQLGAFLAGSDYGTDATHGLSVTYTSELAARWSGAPLGVPLVPVQAYAAAGSLLLAVGTWLWLGSQNRFRPRSGDVVGLWLAGTGASLFLTEIFRDWEGRGVLLGGLTDIPQLVGLGMVLCGGLLLMQWPVSHPHASKQPTGNHAEEDHDGGN